MVKSILKKINSKLSIKIKFPLPYLIPLYHCVSNENILHLKNVVSYKNCLDFENDLDDISKNFEFVEWDFFKNNFNKPNKKPYALLTFDDGLIEFSDIVMPILKRKGIYAINFINPAFVDQTDMMFRFKASLLIEKIKDCNFFGNPLLLNCLNLKANENKENLINSIKSITYKKRNILSELAEIIGFDFQNYIKKHKVYMDLEDLNRAKNEGFGIAAHSWDHPYFYELSLEQQLTNAQKSIDFIKENNFLDECFAFPFTDLDVKNVFFNGIFDKNKNLEYTFGISGVKLDSFERNLHRIPMETNFSAKEEIDFESNYFQLKKLFNKNIVKR